MKASMEWNQDSIPGLPISKAYLLSEWINTLSELTNVYIRVWESHIYEKPKKTKMFVDLKLIHREVNHKVTQLIDNETHF
jgi:hypothetical protein